MRRTEALLPVALAVAGAVAAFGPMVSSGFSRMITDEGDTRHLNYILENAYRWAASGGSRADVWSPAVFAPVRNTGPYCDLLLGVMPFYAPWRALGFPPDTALQIWMFVVALLNFAAAYAVLRRLLSRSVWASALGAFVFAFGSTRTAALAHQQLLFHGFTVVAAAAAFAALRDARPGGRRRLWIWLLFAGVVAQFYAGYYLAWFLVFGLAVALAWVAVLGETRARLLVLLREEAATIVLAAAVSALALWPLASHYLEAARSVAPREQDVAVSMLPKLQSWLYLGPRSWLYGGTARWPLFRHLEPFEWEKRLGLGLVTSSLVLWGLWRERHAAAIRILVATFVTIVLVVTLFPGAHTLWRYVYRWAPGAEALRAVARVGLLFLVPAAVGVAFALDALAPARRGLASALTLLVFLEQGQSQPSYDKHAVRARLAALERALPRDVDAFYYSPVRPPHPFWESQLDAMWLQMNTGVPTVNGYSCSLPRNWEPLLEHAIRTDADEARLRDALDAWIDRNGLHRERVFWLKAEEPPGGPGVSR